MKKPSTTLGISERKAVPLYRGVVRFFPAALAAVAHASLLGCEKHSPGKPMHHDRGKSADHADALIRHLVDMEEDFGRGAGLDEWGVPQVAYVAWRALALCQEWLEKHDGAPAAPGSKP